MNTFYPQDLLLIRTELKRHVGVTNVGAILTIIEGEIWETALQKREEKVGKKGLSRRLATE